MDRDRHADPDRARVARAAMTASNASTSLSSSPRTTTAPGRSRSTSPTASRLPPAVRRPQVDHRPTAVVRQAVVDEPGSGLHESIAATTAARAAATSSAWRTWKATDGPLRSTNSQRGCPSSWRRPRPAPRRSRVWPPTPGSVVRRGVGPPAAWQPAVLEAVVAEVLDPADADARRDVGHGPPGQDGDVKAPRPSGREAAEAPKGPPRERLDAGRGRVTRPDARASRRSRRRPAAGRHRA